MAVGKQVIRIEHDNGWGVFNFHCHKKSRGAPSIWDIYGLRHFGGRHADFPEPSDEFLNRESGGTSWFCAYHVHNFETWVQPNEIRMMHNKLDLKVMLFTVTEFQAGECQVLFTKESIIDAEDITSKYLK